MRPDMGRVIIERARRGSSSRGIKARSYGKIVRTEDGFEYEGLTRIPSRMTDDKNFTDVLGPFKNFLRSSVGRPWDDVYSDIASILGKADWGVRHILTQHLDVETNTFVNEFGRVRYFDRWGESIPGEGDFYVDPVTRKLCLVGSTKLWKTYGHRERRDTRPVEYATVKLSETTEYRWINGVWYFMRYDKKSERVFVGHHERFKTPIYEWRERISIVEKKQLNKKELRDFRSAHHKIEIVKREWTEEEKLKRYGKRLIRL